MDPKNRKIVKMLTLLISSLLIAAVSAQVYTYMFMDATVGVKTTGMRFVAGTNFEEVGGQLHDNNQRVTFSKMNGTAGQLVTYPNPVGIQNNDEASHTIELVLHSWTGTPDTPLYNITITMYDEDVLKGERSIVLVPGEGEGHVTTSGDATIPGGGTTWRVEWSIWWKGIAKETDSVQVSLRLVIKS